MTTDVEAASINVPSRTDDSENKVYSESMPAMTTTNDTVSHGAVNQPFIVHKKRGVICEGECTSQLLNYRHPSANAFFVAAQNPRYVKFALRES